MSIWDRAPTPIRAHWQRVFFPAGFVLNLWGNTLYGTPHRAAGLIMFFSGLILILSGRRSWRGFTVSWRTPKRVRRWVGQTWNEPKWKRRWVHLKLTIWTIAVLAVVRHTWALLINIEQEPDRVVEHVASAQLLMGASVWGQSAEPKDVPTKELLDGLSARIFRAVLGRTVANAAGIYLRQ